MNKAIRKRDHLWSELDRSIHMSTESADAFLREEGYDPDQLASGISTRIKQTIARLKKENKARPQ